MDSKAEQEENGRGRLVDCVLKVSLWLIVRTFPPSPSPHPLLLSLLLRLISTPSRLSPPSKKVFPPPDLHQEALNHRRPLLSQPPIQPRKVCLRMCVWLCVFMCVCVRISKCAQKRLYTLHMHVVLLCMSVIWLHSKGPGGPPRGSGSL